MSNLNPLFNFHSLHYNLMYATSNLYGFASYLPYLPIDSDLADKYSDIVDDGAGNFHDVAHPSQILFKWGDAEGDIENAIQNAMADIHTWQSSTQTEEEATAMNQPLNLFGLSYLCWDKYSIQDEQGNWVYIHPWAATGSPKMLNGMRREVLMGKLRTMAIIGATGAVAYYGGKYIKNRYNL